MRQGRGAPLWVAARDGKRGGLLGQCWPRAPPSAKIQRGPPMAMHGCTPLFMSITISAPHPSAHAICTLFGPAGSIYAAHSSQPDDRPNSRHHPRSEFNLATRCIKTAAASKPTPTSLDLQLNVCKPGRQMPSKSPYWGSPKSSKLSSFRTIASSVSQVIAGQGRADRSLQTLRTPSRTAVDRRASWPQVRLGWRRTAHRHLHRYLGPRPGPP